MAGSSFSPTANLATKGITNHPNRESQNAGKSTAAPAFLAKIITCSDQITPNNQSLPNSSRATSDLDQAAVAVFTRNSEQIQGLGSLT
ncbi:MAG: hypothetical protein WCC59_10410, partial [Terriglobales bacterium]